MPTNYGLTSLTPSLSGYSTPQKAPTYGGVSWDQFLINAREQQAALLQRPRPYSSINEPSASTGLESFKSSGAASSSSPSYDMTALMNEIRNMPTETTTTVEQNPSAQLEAMYAQMQGNVANLQQGMGQAYQAKQGTYEGLLTALADMFRTTGSRGAGAVQTSALASGLTPMEASQQGQNTLLQALQAYAPERANLQSQQADVGVQLQNALAGVMQGIQLPLSNMMSPYYQGVAGSTQTTDDPMQKMGLMSNLASSMQGHQLEQQRINQQGQQFGQSMDFNQQQLAQNMRQFLLGQQQAGSQFGQTMGLNQQQLAQRGQQFGQTLGLDQARMAQQGQQVQQSMQATQALNAMLEQGRTQRAQAGVTGRADLQQSVFDERERLRQLAIVPSGQLESDWGIGSEFWGFSFPSMEGFTIPNLEGFEASLPTMPSPTLSYR